MGVFFEMNFCFNTDDGHAVDADETDLVKVRVPRSRDSDLILKQKNELLNQVCIVSMGNGKSLEMAIRRISGRKNEIMIYGMNLEAVPANTP